jgi:ubiquitin-like protein Pup
MAEQERPTTRRRASGHDEEQAETKTGVGEKGEKLKSGIDEILEEIDSVLEENAEEFVKSYIQRGGE